MKRRRRLRTFVWENVLRDYAGLVVVTAYSEAHARRLLAADAGGDRLGDETGGPPRELRKPEVVYVAGGG